MKTSLLLHFNEKSLGSLQSLEIPSCPTKKISEICLVVDLDGYLPNSYPKKWKNVPIKIFECTGDSFRNVIDYLIHVETVYFTNNFNKFLIPILRSLPNIYGFTLYGEITIHEIFYEHYETLLRYFSKVKQKSVKTQIASDSTNIYNQINNLSKEHWNKYQFFDISSDNDDLIDIFIKRLKPKVNSDFEELDWNNAIINIGGRKNFNFYYLEDHFDEVTQHPKTFIIKNYDRISEPYKTEIISVIRSHLKPAQKILFFRESSVADNPFPTFMISLPKLSRIRNTDMEIKLFVFMILEAELEGQQRELLIKSNSDLVNNILVSSELLYYGPAVIIGAIKKILSSLSTTTIDLSTYDFWYELFNNLPVKNKLIFKNLIRNLLSDETESHSIFAPAKNTTESSTKEIDSDLPFELRFELDIIPKKNSKKPLQKWIIKYNNKKVGEERYDARFVQIVEELFKNYKKKVAIDADKLAEIIYKPTKDNVGKAQKMKNKFPEITFRQLRFEFQKKYSKILDGNITKNFIFSREQCYFDSRDKLKLRVVRSQP